MTPSKLIAAACSTALFGATFALAQPSGPEQKQQTQEQSKQSKQSTQQRKQAHNQVAKKAGQPTNVLVTGQIIEAKDVALAATAGDKHRLFRVKTNGGNEVVVDIGVPQGEVARADFAKGDRIIAMGKPARINGRPVLFAASIAEMKDVERSKPVAATSQNQPQSSQDRQSGKAQQTASKQSGQRTAANVAAPDAVIIFFETENLARDDYGYYDEDFAWTTEDRVFDAWDDTSAWDKPERAHYDVFGYDDAGEAGMWDW